MAAGLPLPKSVVANGWLLFEESKMSKSRGNVVRTETILDAFGPLCPPSHAAVIPSEPEPFEGESRDPHDFARRATNIRHLQRTRAQMERA